MRTVSVHIVTFNSAEYIVDCLDAVLHQAYPIDRILVVDNASTDDTLEKLRAYEDKVQLVANKNNLGFAAAHNQCIHLSASDFYLVLNPDVTLHPYYVYNLVAFMDKNARVGSVTGKLLRRSDATMIDSAGLLINKARRAFDLGARQNTTKWDEVSEVFGVSGAAALYARSMVQSVSMDGEFFDSDFFAYKEDVDVAWRAQLLGWNSYYVPSAIAFHERSWKEGSRDKQPVFIKQHSYINRYRMMIKNDQWVWLLKHFPHLLLFEVASIIYVLFKEPFLLRAWVQLFKDYNKLLRKRKWIQVQRKKKLQQIYSFFQ
ncbi:glycosyltransferase family 2 protein [Paenibacillus mesophilus]|uniref:glycosyltransferase family 2 protein n=1 Tax=Paenibacillus mesophilus TaxID=2582849 RepID=UPI00110E8909|nr:glycosyltransferase family 2 protein [Paenibacillus mesophilus]TMV50789.1 glycosyltransferase family 2 protein [Paenibacillus mesophilus]